MPDQPLNPGGVATPTRRRPGIRPRKTFPLFVLATAATLGLAACGFHTQSGVPPGQRAQAEANLLMYAQCMRSNGITDYPNPIVNPKLGVGIPNISIPNSPTYQAAQNARQRRRTRPAAAAPARFQVRRVPSATPRWRWDDPPKTGPPTKPGRSYPRGAGTTPTHSETNPADQAVRSPWVTASISRPAAALRASPM